MKLKLTGVLLVAAAVTFAADSWKPAAGPLMTRWAADVSAKKPLDEYPRPQFVRDDWENLNGLWDYAITEKDAGLPTQWAGRILVPFPIESALSGVMKRVSEKERLWYRRTFEVPGSWRRGRVLLNFGAVDWQATVFVNGKELGRHEGGYDAFSFDITEALNAKGANELVVSVWDPTDAGPQPRGKQVQKPHGIWYTPSSGIWQTVWIEPVNRSHIERIKVTPNLDEETVSIEADFLESRGAWAQLRAKVTDGWRTVAEETSLHQDQGPVGSRARATVTLKVPRAKRWSPESPHLYKLKLELHSIDKTGKKVDEVESYFGMRKISLARDAKGRLRIQLNNTNYFQVGPLDQGFWPDGLYTAPTDKALRYDIEKTKELGFNMARKHVKVEPARWYYWADKLGLLVWQDLPSGDKSAPWKGPSGIDGKEMERTPESKAIFEKELKSMIEQFYNHPSIVIWVPFNEGWGQFDTVRILDLTKQLDPTRLVDGPSGGNHFPGAGHIIDHHQYPGPGAPAQVTDRAMVLGEFGGLGLPVRGHTWQNEKNWGYRSFTNSEALTKAYVGLMRKLQPMIEEHGLSAAIYTQTTDVEVEINGLMTYDRKVMKMPTKTVAMANRFKFPPEPLQRVISPTASQHVGATWRYTTTKPTEDWFKPEFDANSWREGKAGFGTKDAPNSIIGTEWNSSDIWLRREFQLSNGIPREVKLLLHHDEDATIYINGVLATQQPRFVTDYQEVEISPEARRALRPGRNVIAVHCKQTTGGQYIDAGVFEMVPAR